MEEETKLKLFISYAHKDEACIDEFNRHVAFLEKNGLIEIWYDREILPGEELHNEINENLENADIICLFMSVDFIYSDYCTDEKNKALKLRTEKGISVIPIILSSCPWQDDEEISDLLVLPKDGKPIKNFPNRDEVWHEHVYEGLKKITKKVSVIKQLKTTEDFEKFLQDAEMLTKAHFQKEIVLLDDIFVYPDLDKFDFSKEDDEKINSEVLLKNLLDYPKIVITGENQSGKTTFCKKLFKEFREKNFVPVYINETKNKFKRDIDKTISRSFSEQYQGMDIEKIDKDRIIPIIDDFHFAMNKERHINDLSAYQHCILVVDDIFSINISDEKLIGTFTRFKIREFLPSLRYDLIKKWVMLTDKEIDNYKSIDKRIELIKNILGRTIGSGIMPSYPFFILSAIVTYDTFEMPLEQEITSQGYCYQALIYFYLRKQGVKNDEIDIYINFLTELAFFIYKEKKYELTPQDFKLFMDSYSEKYNLPIEPEILLKNLSLIASKDNFNNYAFNYPYLYFFFVAKYLAEHIADDKLDELIENIMKNLHVDENAYVAVFISHHSRNDKILEKIEEIAAGLFEEYEPATLTKDEVKFFDEQEDILVEAVLNPNSTVESERKNRLNVEDGLEESEYQEQKETISDGSLQMELRRAIKTSEVIGCIIKNRSGSLEKIKLEYIFKEAMNVHLRILSSYFELIKNEEGQNAIIEVMSQNLKKSIEDNEEGLRELNDAEVRKLAKFIFWNLSFLIVNSIIDKIVHSLGSDKLTLIENKVCDEVNTPAAFMVKHGILMWYDKNLRKEEIAKRIKERDFSDVAERGIKFMIVNHVSLHPSNFRERQQIENQLGIPVQRLLKESLKESDNTN